ncbi:mitotic checkpoint regulator, MAD2B-interacting-domain-containing protein [Syncephalis pseudoplumigaleata]|uniref:Mitotic checkpoint regulator, MAD2B-interacting-domain-containing protein n=1 Tax=Syncephalis pseudoplumigaleata TaxID=1712513 RepID=A0A4P9Z1A2_9FUNG|nr:mitotic checkpoint regulator, MAD2B-interacting-domain-containing protein [Syncephalis pseudoplumigaleata]|eukprot:RKP26108.1 mitotic checkpoint regulator, MAD2B-interacting-domain-containing protein [Syncephalis pseudoplumigaleata]
MASTNRHGTSLLQSMLAVTQRTMLIVLMLALQYPAQSQSTFFLANADVHDDRTKSMSMRIMSLVADYASDSDDNSTSEPESTVQPPLDTASGARRGIAAVLPPPKGRGTSSDANAARQPPPSAASSTEEARQSRKVKIVVPLPDRAALSDDDDDNDSSAKHGPVQNTTGSASNAPRSSLSAFLPPPKQYRPPKSLGQAGSTARHDQLGTALGEDAHIVEPVSSSSEAHGDTAANEAAVSAMIPHSLRKRQQQKTSSSKGQDAEAMDLFSLNALEESESREYGGVESITRSIGASTAALDDDAATVATPSTSSNSSSSYGHDTYHHMAYPQEGVYAYDGGVGQASSDAHATDGYNDQMTLSDEAIAALSGRRKRQYDFAPVNIVDVNLADRLGGPGRGDSTDDVGTNAAMQLNAVAGSNKRHRHNIMYLGNLASNYEQAFEERAALGRKNRRETAAKYGFR